jgi:hypothetical protein
MKLKLSIKGSTWNYVKAKILLVIFKNFLKDWKITLLINHMMNVDLIQNLFQSILRIVNREIKMIISHLMIYKLAVKIKILIKRMMMIIMKNKLNKKKLY